MPDPNQRLLQADGGCRHEFDAHLRLPAWLARLQKRVRGTLAMKVMRLLSLIVLIACMAPLVVPAAEATTYRVSDTAGSLTVTGFITTDGTMSILGIADIVNWNLIIGGSVNGVPPALIPGSSEIELYGRDLIATATTLTFTYTDLASGWFTIIVSSCSYICTQAYFCTAGCDSPYRGVLELISALPPKPRESVGLNFHSSDQIIANLSQTPIPTALPLFATGLGVTGLLVWRRKQQRLSPITALRHDCFTRGCSRRS
jgi:hypothetical protein